MPSFTNYQITDSFTNDNEAFTGIMIRTQFEYISPVDITIPIHAAPTSSHPSFTPSPRSCRPLSPHRHPHNDPSQLSPLIHCTLVLLGPRPNTNTHPYPELRPLPHNPKPALLPRPLPVLPRNPAPLDRRHMHQPIAHHRERSPSKHQGLHLLARFQNHHLARRRGRC